MAGLTLEYNPDEWEIFKKLMMLFPQFRAQAMGFIGARGKKLLKQRFLSGQELNLKGDDADARDVAGRRMISYKVMKRGEMVRIKSYPMNLFEGGRLLRSGRRERGKRVITGKFKALMNSELQKIINEFDRTILEKELQRIG